mgnify:CR=1 FL=1
MSLWRTPPNIEQLNAIQKNTIGEVLDIRFESFDEQSLTASMVIDHRTHQPYGLLHGGASVVLVRGTEADTGSSERLATLLTFASCAGAHGQQPQPGACGQHLEQVAAREAGVGGCRGVVVDQGRAVAGSGAVVAAA